LDKLSSGFKLVYNLLNLFKHVISKL